MWHDEWTKSEVDAWLSRLESTARPCAEALYVDQFRSLTQALKERWGHGAETGLPFEDES